MRLRHRWSRIEHHERQEREEAFHSAAFFSVSAATTGISDKNILTVDAYMYASPSVCLASARLFSEIAR
jgi:hypothetical protein